MRNGCYQMAGCGGGEGVGDEPCSVLSKGCCGAWVPAWSVPNRSNLCQRYKPNASKCPQKIAGLVRGKGAAYLEAPVSGSKGPAEAGALIFLTGGAHPGGAVAECVLPSSPAFHLFKGGFQSRLGAATSPSFPGCALPVRAALSTRLPFHSCSCAHSKQGTHARKLGPTQPC